MALRLVTPGQQTRAWARAEIARLKEVKRRKVRLIEGRDQVTPPLQTREERRQGDSNNARMERLLNG